MPPVDRGAEASRHPTCGQKAPIRGTHCLFQHTGIETAKATSRRAAAEMVTSWPVHKPEALTGRLMLYATSPYVVNALLAQGFRSVSHAAPGQFVRSPDGSQETTASEDDRSVYVTSRGLTATGSEA